MAEAKKKEAPVDHYAALGVEKTASIQEITVDTSTAFTIIRGAASLECAGRQNHRICMTRSLG